MVKHTSLLPIKYKNFWIDEQYIRYFDVTFFDTVTNIEKGEKFDEVRIYPNGLVKFLRPDGKCFEGYGKYLEFDEMDEIPCEK